MFITWPAEAFASADSSLQLCLLDDDPFGSAALTVTDTDQAVATGIINFVIHDNRVRFEIDDVAAARAGLTIRARMLRLALTLKPRLQAPFQP